MKQYNFNVMVLLLIVTHSFAESPTWSVDENNFQYTMSFVAFLNIDGNTLTSTSDKVAAFVNGECRGVTSLIYVASEDRYYAYLTVFSNNNGETVNFKVYDAINDSVVDVEKTQPFEIDEHYGDLFQAYSIANPVLSRDSEILNFDFKDIAVNDKIFEGNQITLFLDDKVDVKNLNAIFELSSGAKLYEGAINRVSDENSLNFSNPIQFQVKSEDESLIKQWTVTVKLNSGNAGYYKKDAVCYAGGVIKIVFPQNNEEVTLLKNGTIINKSAIKNGEVIFRDLDVATYIVRVGGNSKEISINQK